VEESKNLVEKSRSPVEISENLTEEREKPVEKIRNLAKESENLAEESGNLMEESRSPVVPENCSTRECLANPAAAVRGPGSLPSCFSPTFITALALTAPIPLEAAAVPLDLSQPTSSLPRLLSVHCWEAVGQNCSPPAAGDAEAGLPTEVPQEEVAAEKPSVPKTPSKGPQEDKGLEKEAVKDSGNAGQDLVADIPEEPGKEVTPDVCRTTGQADPSPGEPEKDSCVGRPAACQRNAPREFYTCPICRKTFLLKINLLIHQRGHTNWAPYVCVHCDRKFMSRKKMRWHLRIWAAKGTCQPSKPEGCPSKTPCPTSQPQPWAPSASCQPSNAKVCSSQGPCPTSQPQPWAPSASCQPSDA
ncbi:ZN777 protein, partial [Cettia cetti]|nr:ZN777 protein [Cettia cetti]